MEAETSPSSSSHHHPQRHQGYPKQVNLPSPGIPGLDVVRALHQTVISLRNALDSSREEVRRLKKSAAEFSEEKYAETVERLALENHVLRRRILEKRSDFFSNDACTGSPPPPSSSARISVHEVVEGAGKCSWESAMDASGEKVSTNEETKTEAAAKSTRPATSVDLTESDRTSRQQRFSSSGATRRHRRQQQLTSIGATLSKEETEDAFIRDSSRLSSASSLGGSKDECNEEQNRAELENNIETSILIERLDIPERDSEDLSLRSVSDGDNSVFSDNADQQSPPPQQQMQQQLQSHHQQKLHQQQHQTDHQSAEHAKLNDQSENDSEELDDIELIFTTDDTCRDLGLQEDLVSITESDAWQHASGGTGQQPVLLKYTKSAEGESLVCNGDKTSSVEEAASSQSSSIDREESVDRFDESSSTRLNKMWSQCSVLVETDISKCGVVEEPEHSARHAARRNTLAAPPTAYRPIIHREVLTSGRRKSAAPLRPVMDRSSGARRESGAQTDISALPAQWRSESYLAHKVAHTFTTLPSKFALPAGVSGRLRLSDKTREARRVMLSDISFTSMVPELSRSADHLCHDPHSQTCFSSRGCGLRTPEVHRRESLGSPAGYWPRCNLGTGLPSPCDCRLSADLYSSRYRGSLSSIPSPGLEVVSGPPRRHSWRATAASFDTWRAPVATSTPRPTWSSMPSSPTHVHPPATSSRVNKNVPKRTRSKVTFQECPMTRGSLPNLRSDLVAGDNSGDSTESLIDEAEDYLRRSIDSMLTISSASASTDYWSRQSAARRKRTRRYSEPDLAREWTPPRDARPYLPKIPRDLKLDHLVKVISPEGRVLQGRVRYVGPVPGREETHVGVELPYINGSSDGTFHGRRFFDCEPDRAVFVPFKKVVLAWCTT